MKPLLLVVVGTDVHPFDRLIGWIGRWLADSGENAPRCIVQHGSSQRPDFDAESVAYLPHQDLQTALAEASIVVSHGGPATITECRRATRLPIVVPRDPDLGEHVDGHQQRFARMFCKQDLIRLATSELELRRSLDEAMSTPEAFRVATPAEQADTSHVPPAVQAVGGIIDELVGARRAKRAGRALAKHAPVIQLPVQRTAAALADSLDTAPAPVPVLFVGGIGRSGSTLLDRMLGGMPEVCAIGEVVHLWERGLAQGEKCGCGQPFGRCDFWRTVGELAFGGWDAVDVERVRELSARVDRTRFVPQLALPRLPKALRRDLTEYADYYARIYRAVQAVSGCTVVVDSSKHASLAFVLRWATDVDLRVLHLVRDSRGVAYSWAKHVRRPDVVDGEDWMAQSTARSISLQWLGQNAAFHLLGAVGVPVLRERYEDLIAAPEPVLRAIRGFAGLPAGKALPFLADHAVTLSPGHTVSGNPMRFRQGPVALSADEEWRGALPAQARRTVSLLTLPLRLRYRYLAAARRTNR